MEQTSVIRPGTRDIGPVELDAQQMAMVAGGLPRGAWSETEAVTLESTASLLPRGAWDL